MTRWGVGLALLALMLTGCAHRGSGGSTRTRVPITELTSVVGRWDGLLSGLSSRPSADEDLVDVVISERWHLRGQGRQDRWGLPGAGYPGAQERCPDTAGSAGRDGHGAALCRRRPPNSGGRRDHGRRPAGERAPVAQALGAERRRPAGGRGGLSVNFFFRNGGVLPIIPLRVLAGPQQLWVISFEALGVTPDLRRASWSGLLEVVRSFAVWRWACSRSPSSVARPSSMRNPRTPRPLRSSAASGPDSLSGNRGRRHRQTSRSMAPTIESNVPQNDITTSGVISLADGAAPLHADRYHRPSPGPRGRQRHVRLFRECGRQDPDDIRLRTQ